jgi:hypothetical protein
METIKYSEMIGWQDRIFFGSANAGRRERTEEAWLAAGAPRFFRCDGQGNRIWDVRQRLDDLRDKQDPLRKEMRLIQAKRERLRRLYGR